MEAGSFHSNSAASYGPACQTQGRAAHACCHEPTAKRAETINAFLPQLIQYVDVPSLTVYLLAENLLTHEERELVLAKERRDCQVPELLRILRTKGASWYDRFQSALKKAASGPDVHLGHQHLLSILPVTMENEDWECLRASPTLAPPPASPGYVRGPDSGFYEPPMIVNAAPHQQQHPGYDASPYPAHSMLQRVAGVGQHWHALAELTSHMGREIAALEAETVSVAEENEALRGERERAEIRLHELEGKVKRWREECMELCEQQKVQERLIAQLREEIMMQGESCSRDMILQSAGVSINLLTSFQLQLVVTP